MENNVNKIIKVLEKQFSIEWNKERNFNAFHSLIFTVLSQRTKDENTFRAFNQLIKKFKTPKAISQAPLSIIQKLIKPSGFYKVKAKYIKQLSRELMKKHSGKVPNNLNELISLTGVGRKTANCVLVYGFRKSAIPVDVHVHRISNRIGLIKTKNEKESEFALMKLIPKNQWIKVNELFVKLGQNICKANPLCWKCPIINYCNYNKKNIKKS